MNPNLAPPRVIVKSISFVIALTANPKPVAAAKPMSSQAHAQADTSTISEIGQTNKEHIISSLAEILGNPYDLQTYANIGALLLPKEFQAVGGFLIQQPFAHFFTQVLGTALAQGASFNSLGIVWAQIKKGNREL